MIRETISTHVSFVFVSPCLEGDLGWLCPTVDDRPPSAFRVSERDRLIPFNCFRAQMMLFPWLTATTGHPPGWQRRRLCLSTS